MNFPKASRRGALVAALVLMLSSVVAGVEAGPATAVPTAWSVASYPGPPNVSPIRAASCPTETRCFTVGYYDTGSTVRTMVHTWDGSSWSVLPSVDPGPASNLLTAVSCLSADWCMAVGESELAPGVGSVTLTEIWDGANWSAVPSPSAAGKNYLTGISCTTEISCVAVGFAGNLGLSTQTLIEVWDGTDWTIQTSPNPGPTIDELHAVSCTNPTSCVAVGQYYLALGEGGFQIGQSLVETWDGATWSVSPSASPGARQSSLQGVSCLSPTRCAAVGFTRTGVDASPALETLVEVWDGLTWSVTPSPNPGADKNGLLAVSCATATSCVAVGSVDVTGLIEMWDGTSWSATSTPSPAPSSELAGVSCAPASTMCVATGEFHTPPNITQHALIVQGSPPPPPPPPPPTVAGSSGGYVLDGYGGLHPFKVGMMGPPAAAMGAPHWSWDIARAVAVRKDAAGVINGGYELDGFGGVHRLSGAPAITGTPYWSGWDIARDLVLTGSSSGYVLDGWGGVHPFGGAPTLKGLPSWSGWDIARSLVMAGAKRGYVLDGFGGVHAFGGAPKLIGTPSWSGDVARDLVLTGPASGYVLDAFGGVHRFGGAPKVHGTPYWPGRNIARDLAI